MVLSIKAGTITLSTNLPSSGAASRKNKMYFVFRESVRVVHTESQTAQIYEGAALRSVRLPRRCPVEIQIAQLQSGPGIDAHTGY